MSEKIGYARVSTVGQDLEAQRHALVQLGVAPERIHVNHGFSGSDRERPGLREALAACSAGDELVVAKLDRLARSVPDSRDVLDDPTAREVRLDIGGSVHDPADPVGRLLLTVLSMPGAGRAGVPPRTSAESRRPAAAARGRDER